MDAGNVDISSLLRGRAQYPNPPGAPRGLYVIPNWVSETEEQEIVTFLAANKWSDHLSSKRPTQHFGYRYTIQGYQASTENAATDWGVLRRFADRLEQQYPGVKIAQCLANLYFKDTTIGAHRDRETPTVFGVSLVGDINMIWTHMRDKSLKYEACIPRRSLYIMSEEAASDWMHEVPSRKTVKYPDLDPHSLNYGKLVTTVKKPDWYTRVSITYRHFHQPLAGNDRLAVLSSSLSSSLPNPSSGLEACHLRGVIPNHQGTLESLYKEHPWTNIVSRFGSNLSRMVCHGSHLQSQTSGIYGVWVELFCEQVLGIRVKVEAGFANLYPDGKAALPAHRDQYGHWVFGLSFGETRTFDFITKGVKPTAKTGGPGEIISIPMESGDVLLFSPSTNDIYRHRILAEPARKGMRINITYFISPLFGQSIAAFLNPPPLQNIPTFEQAQALYNSRQLSSHTNQPPRVGGADVYNVYEDEDGKMFIQRGEEMIPVASLEEALFNFAFH